MDYLIANIVEDYIVNQLPISLTVEAVEAPVGASYPKTQKVKFCNDKWLKLFNRVIIRGVLGVDDVYVDEIAPAEWDYDKNGYANFVINSADEVFTINTTAVLPSPLFFNGTLLNTSEEWSKYNVASERDKLPFIWLTSPTNEEWGNSESQIKKAGLKFWLVHWSNWSKLNADRQAEAVEPLFALFHGMIEAIDNNAHVFPQYENLSTRDFPKFGRENENGVGTTMFNSTLSAVEVDILLSIFANLCKKC